MKVRTPTHIELQQNVAMHILLGIQKTDLLKLPKKS